MKKKARPITSARALGCSSDEKSEIRFDAGFSPNGGIYEVWINGLEIAQVTDKWMAEILLIEAMKNRKPKKPGKK